MQVSLELNEQEILIWAIQSAVADLGGEIADTENQELREDLKNRKAVLKNILQRLRLDDTLLPQRPSDSRSMKDAEGVQFLQWCLPRLGLMWPGYYKVRRQVYKHLRRRLESLGLGSLAKYRIYLEAHPEEWGILDTFCWISISRFYRDRSVFQFLEQEVLPELTRQVLVKGERMLRCWSLGCASGEEPYSLSLLWKLELQAQFPTVRFVILATDVDEQAIAHAQRGCYPPSSLRDLPESWRMQGFDHTSQGFWIKPEFRESVTLLVQDIRQAAPEEVFHLILCRYVTFTYFDASLQSKMLRRLVERMDMGSALVVGKNERLPHGEFGLIPWSQQEGVYRRATPAMPAM